MTHIRNTRNLWSTHPEQWCLAHVVRIQIDMRCQTIIPDFMTIKYHQILFGQWMNIPLEEFVHCALWSVSTFFKSLDKYRKINYTGFIGNYNAKFYQILANALILNLKYDENISVILPIDTEYYNDIIIEKYKSLFRVYLRNIQFICFIMNVLLLSFTLWL